MVLVRMVFHFVDDDYYDSTVVDMTNVEEEEGEEELLADEVKQQVVIQVYTVDDQKDGKYDEVVSLVVVGYDGDIDYNGYLYC